jgi:pyridoxamine 5'-phosphate oxidase
MSSAQIETQLNFPTIVEWFSQAQAAESIKYFTSRPKGSQIGAWVSHQSQIISSKDLLNAQYQKLMNQFKEGEVPFPDFWGGYRVVPSKIEFWQGGDNR